MKLRLGVSLGVLWASVSPGVAFGAPTLRSTADQRGDFALVGSTFGHDCGNGTPAPVVGVLGACGTQVGDSAPDVFFRSDSPTDGAAEASTAIAPGMARSTAVLGRGTTKGVSVPVGAFVTYARLYWSASLPAAMSPGATVTVDRIGGGAFTSLVTADATSVRDVNGKVWYQATADVTSLVRERGTGAYRVSGASLQDVRSVNDNERFGGWALVVFYYLDTAPVRKLSLFDGFDIVENGASDTDFGGFVVPAVGADATLGVVSFEGDAPHVGDSFAFGPDVGGLQLLSNPTNPVDNFFNGSRTSLGAPVSVIGDLPQLTGGPGSYSGIDLDVVDVSARVSANQTKAVARAASTADTFGLATLGASVATLMPDLTKSPKTVRNVTRSVGGTIAGDVLEYTIAVKNTGSDASVRTVLEDAIPAGTTYVAGSMSVAPAPAPAVGVTKTDAAGDDEADLDVAGSKVIFRLGTGANATLGGSLAVDAEVFVRFRVKVAAGATSVANKGVLRAGGLTATAQGITTDSGWGTMGAGNEPDAPVVTLVGLDTDGDTLPDVFETSIGTDPTKPDSDDDGVPDGVEVGPDLTRVRDNDFDGKIDALDDDDDNDGLPTRAELGASPASPVDTDKDGRPDYRDEDDDEDSILTKTERPNGANVDTDKDGAPNHLDADDDGDGLVTKEERADAFNALQPDDVDRDGLVNWLDPDADNDGITDLADGRGDDDRDGIPNFLDAASAKPPVPPPSPTGTGTAAPPQGPGATGERPPPPNDDGSLEGGGISCAVPGRGLPSGGWVLGTFVGLAVLAARRRRRG